MNVIPSISLSLQRNFTVPTKFTKIFRMTALAYQKALQIERETGEFPQSILHGMILEWANEALRLMDIDLEVLGVPAERQKAVLFVGNHISYLDIPLLMANVPLVFVAKEEISKWLVFGNAAKKCGTVFVKRDSDQSRANAAEAISDAVLRHHQSIGIFPSGTTSITEVKPWRHGAFKVAHTHGIPIQPFRIRYKPLRKVAYIDDDMFAPHLVSVLRLRQVTATIEFGDVRMVQDPAKDCEEVQRWAKEFLIHVSP